MQRTEINADDGAKGGVLGVVRRAHNGENAQSSQESREPHGDDTAGRKRVLQVTQEGTDGRSDAVLQLGTVVALLVTGKGVGVQGTPQGSKRAPLLVI
jgi:hypothetical protein